MEAAAAPAPANIGGRREPSTDPVKAQGILNSVMRKSQSAAKLWPQRWYFYSKIREIQEEEAQKCGMTVEEYRAALQSHSSQLEPKQYPVVVDPSPWPVPPTSAAMIGRRAQCPLERFGRLVKTDRDYPLRPPLRPGQIYDPYKQTVVFLGPLCSGPAVTLSDNPADPAGFGPMGPLLDADISLSRTWNTYAPSDTGLVLIGRSVDGDPISYKLPPSRCEMTDEMWARPQQLTVSPLGWDNLERIMNETE